MRDGTVIYDTTIDSLRRFNDDVREVAAGYECGIVLANYQDVKEGDVLEVYETRASVRARASPAVASQRARRASCESRPVPSSACPRYVALLLIHLHFPDAGSLKAKRKELVVGQGAAAHAPGRRRSRGRRPGHVAALDARRRADQRLARGSSHRPPTTSRRWLLSRFPEGVRVERSLTSFEDAGGIG